MDRRELIQWLVATAGLRCLESLAPADLLALGRDVHRGAGGDRPLLALTAHAERTVAAAAERIIPATDTPGTTAAGVTAFIDKMLADWHTPAERDHFLAGLRDLDARCRARASHDFVACAEADQVAVLNELDAEAAPVRDHWFGRLKYLTVYGYCTSEAGMRALGLFPLPWRYDGCAPVTTR
ncbi:MAG: gluconate 2-dehydrogenase subunit 3 family protein [Gemmatimonadales bacterium]